MAHPYYYPDLDSSSGSSPDPHATMFGESDQLDDNHNSAAAADYEPLHRHVNVILVGILIALICAFLSILAYLVFPYIRYCVRRKLASSERRVRLRYETIEGWLISKVR